MSNMTHEQLRELYLEDLKLPDTFHGRTTPKVRYPGIWESITPYYKTTPMDISGKRVWVWSDIHFGHKNIIKYAGRPFDDVSAMHYALITAYKKLVAPEDVVIWNGDISFMGLTPTNEILASLPGYKIHIVGNHDIDRSGKLIKFDVDERHMCYAVMLDGVQLLFTHYHMDVVPKGAVNVHGHIHQQTANPWNINVCVEHTNYAPMLLTDLLPRARDYLESV
jgi:calcineurin-like phosphoesterase family protein